MAEQWFTSIGLSLDIVGVCLLYVFGLPSRMESALVLTSSKREKGERSFRVMSLNGLLALVLGFGMQIVGAWLG